jgi:hypothetical protein
MYTIIIFALFFLVLVTLERWLRAPREDEEPYFVPQPLPLIGHLLGMIRHGSHYYSKIW